MYLPSASQLLTVWESGLRLTPIERGLRLLASLFPDASDEDLARITIGQRDAWLLTLRSQLFGEEIASVVACPQCGETLELNFSVSEVRVSRDALPPQHQEVVIHAEGYAVRCRPPTSADLLALAEMAGAANPQRALLDRCIVAIDTDGAVEAAPGPSLLPDRLAASLVEQLAQADPQADVQLALVCPACSHPWSAQFDILSFLWSELSDWVQRTLREVHLLATAYGWREADILALSVWRRRWYLQLIGE